MLRAHDGNTQQRPVYANVPCKFVVRLGASLVANE